MNQNLRVNKANFHVKGFALGLVLKQRRNATRKSPIANNGHLMMTSFDYKYQNALGQVIAFGIFSFVVKNCSCVTDCSEMHSGSCSQMTPSCKGPIYRCELINHSTGRWTRIQGLCRDQFNKEITTARKCTFFQLQSAHVKFRLVKIEFQKMPLQVQVAGF